MPRISRSKCRIIAIFIWFFGILLFFGLGLWNMDCARRDAENHMINESGRMASQLAAILSSSRQHMDQMAIRALVAGVMEDESVYAVKIDSNEGIAEGERRNYLWEPVPWDDEIAENCVQGMNPIKIGGQRVGSVQVWISPRLSVEEDGLLASRERWRFFLCAFLWTSAFFLLFWQWGDLRRLRHALGNGFSSEDNGEEKNPERIVLGLKQDEEMEDRGEREQNSAEAPKPVVDADAGRRFQRRNPDAWRVTAGMFRQTFARGPALIGRLYAEGETAGLCHLGRMLEQAAPCVGADRLAKAAREMQTALNDPDCQARAIPVEECAAALDEVLTALCGNGQWRSNLNCARS